MDDQKKRDSFLKDEESDPNDLKAFIRRKNNQNIILQKLLNSINSSNKSIVKGKT